ncbi:MAG: hypothetical protein CMJ41_02470 [Phycisphaerae bacterium]|nr:hypothetical protein [Phycisphaerae bacterium]HBZ96803.1 hypothetical protein [Phycisphaerales bacterium]|tara:strand:- start:1087 stop:1293 length:207 start_codon:yes stop_codon:yes gene_type:complete
MTNEPRKPLMRCLGEFFGNIAEGIRTNPAEENRQEVSRTVEEHVDGDVTLRRTTIEEIEIHPGSEEQS